MVEVENHLSRGELAALIREETDPRIKDRLNFIQHLYDGDEVSEAASKVGYATTTGYNWIHAWNDTISQIFFNIGVLIPIWSL